MSRIVHWIIAITLLCITFQSQAGSYEPTLEAIKRDWATTKYQTSKENQLSELQKLIARAALLDQQYPNQPPIMVWYATILGTYAATQGGLQVLPEIKKARSLLETAIKINSRVENGFGEAVLGSLFARVPSWPIAFGNKKKAREHFLAALDIDPRGIDSNYYYGDFLVDLGEYAQARKHLEIAQDAVPRPDHAIQDNGRKTEIAKSLEKLHNLVS